MSRTMRGRNSKEMAKIVDREERAFQLSHGPLAEGDEGIPESLGAGPVGDDDGLPAVAIAARAIVPKKARKPRKKAPAKKKAKAKK